MIPPEQMDAVDKKVAADVEQIGWSCIGVFPTHEGHSPPFNYTVGLPHSYQHPELLMMGMSNQQLHSCLAVAVQLIQGGTRFAADTYSTEVLVALRVAFVEVLDVHHEDYCLSMATRLQGEIPALQMVWPDREDRFPWDPDFDPEYKHRQILAGPWRGE